MDFFKVLNLAMLHLRHSYKKEYYLVYSLLYNFNRPEDLSCALSPLAVRIPSLLCALKPGTGCFSHYIALTVVNPC